MFGWCTLFFDKKGKTKEVWYFEHPYPDGVKMYNKTRPIRLEEFDLEKKWWNKRKESELAWKVSLKEIIEKNYNLDFKNPSVKTIEHRDPKILLKEYQDIQKQLNQIRDALAKELESAINR